MRFLSTLATLLLGLAVVFWAPATKAHCPDHAHCDEEPPPAVVYVSVSGLALTPDHNQINGPLGYLSDGEAFPLEAGDVFSFAPVTLQDGAIISSLICVFRDDSVGGYIQASLIRGPINTVDPVIPLQIVANTGTSEFGANADFQERSGPADAARALVDNSQYGYFLRVDFLNGPGGVSLSLRGCIMDYE
jgi:hypothetical protein